MNEIDGIVDVLCHCPDSTVVGCDKPLRGDVGSAACLVQAQVRLSLPPASFNLAGQSKAQLDVPLRVLCVLPSERQIQRPLHGYVIHPDLGDPLQLARFRSLD